MSYYMHESAIVDDSAKIGEGPRIWAQYTARVSNREQLQQKRKEKDIPTAVHYPIPLQKCFQYLGGKEGDFPISKKMSKEVMSLPMNRFVTDKK